MGFGKSFGLGLLMYLLLNFGLSIVVVAINNPSGIGAIFTLEGILNAMLSPVLAGYGAFVSIANGLSLTGIFSALLLILPGLLGALVAGKSSDSAGAAFGGWLLAAIVTSVIYTVLIIVIPTMLDLGTAMLIALMGGQLFIILAGVSVGFLWGGIAAVTAGP